MVVSKIAEDLCSVLVVYSKRREMCQQINVRYKGADSQRWVGSWEVMEG